MSNNSPSPCYLALAPSVASHPISLCLSARNDALAQALLDMTEMSVIPESLVEETTQLRFQAMLTDFKQQGTHRDRDVDVDMEIVMDMDMRYRV